jgi:hypothetical protein
MLGKCERCGWVGEVEEVRVLVGKLKGQHCIRGVVCVDSSECLKRASIEQPDMVSSG